MDVPEKIELKDGTQLTLTWEDGTVNTFTAQELRSSCACADCRSAAEQRPSALRLVALTSITDVKLVGSYGVNFTFAPDGHRTGIFTFDQLRALRS